MIKKTFFAALLIAIVCVAPAQAQFKSLGKTLNKVAKDAGKAAKEMATDAAMELGANKASEQIVKFMDQNNTLSAEDSEYTTRLKTVLGDKFNDADGKALDIKVYENPEANIITLNNGNIRLYSGMMDLLSDDELQALIALQAGHIQSGNIKDNLLKIAGGDNVENATSAQLEKMLSFSGDKIGSIINEILQFPYTQDQNTKADSYAKQLLNTKGLGDEGFSNLIGKINQLANIDLESENLDENDETTAKATVAAKFVQANSLR